MLVPPSLSPAQFPSRTVLDGHLHSGSVIQVGVSSSDIVGNGDLVVNLLGLRITRGGYRSLLDVPAGVTSGICLDYDVPACTKGGGIHVVSGTLRILSSDIYGNIGAWGGGLAITGASVVTISGSNIRDNAAYKGGGVFVSAGTTKIDNSNITRNTAQLPDGDLEGGGLYVDSGTITLRTTLVTDNQANQGSNIQPISGITYFAFPLVPGHWLQNAECRANRQGCGSGDGTAGICPLAREECSRIAGSASNQWRPTVTVTRVIGEAAAADCSTAPSDTSDAPTNPNPNPNPEQAVADAGETRQRLLAEDPGSDAEPDPEVQDPGTAADPGTEAPDPGPEAPDSGPEAPDRDPEAQDPCGEQSGANSRRLATTEAYEFRCTAPTFIQNCNWQTSACAALQGRASADDECPLGKDIYALPNVPLDGVLEKRCPAGYLGSSESRYQFSTTCAGPCPRGTYCPTEVTLVPLQCPDGFYCDEGTVTPQPCPKGTHKNGQLTVMTSVEDCLVCPEGTSCPVGSHNPVPCPPGQYSDQVRQESCLRCEPGKFQDEAGTTACKQCNPGCESSTWTSHPCRRSRLCTASLHDLLILNLLTAFGRAIAADYCGVGFPAELPCPAGTHYNASAEISSSKDDCAICPQGTACSIGSIQPRLCAPGTFGNLPEQQLCVSCPPGTFQEAKGATACNPCTEGYYCDLGAAAALPCPAGKRRDPSLTVMTSEQDCIPCGEGTFCPVGAAEATACAPGTYNDEAQQPTCKRCAAGTYQESEGQTACQACEAGYYCKEGAAAALPCPGGTAKPSGFPGSMTSKSQCVVCPAGTACSVGTNEPAPCLPGSYGDTAGKEKCDLCAAGKFTGTTRQTQCDDCTPGSLCVEGSSAPQPCPGGRHANQTVLYPDGGDTITGFLSSLDQCVVCPAGTACSVGTNEPAPCLPGSYGDTAGKEKCDLCAAGKFTGTTRQTQCDDCTPGSLCVEGSSAPQPCPGGRHANQTVLYPDGGDTITGFLSSLDQCVVCPAGTACPVGTGSPAPCLPGSYADQPKTQACLLCPLGQYQDIYGQTACQDCPRGFFCKAGSATPVPCSGGTYSNRTARSSSGSCLPVPIHFWSPLGSMLPEPCPPSGFSCPGALDVAAHEKAGISPPGSKPIIQAVGGSTETVEVPVVRTSISLDLTPEEFTAERDALLTSLAQQYGVDPSQITLDAAVDDARRRRLANMLITVTIALPPSPPPSAGASSPALASTSSLHDSIANVSATDLTTSIGAALGRPVQVTVTAMAARVTISAIRNFVWYVAHPPPCAAPWCRPRLALPLVRCPLYTQPCWEMVHCGVSSRVRCQHLQQRDGPGQRAGLQTMPTELLYGKRIFD